MKDALDGVSRETIDRLHLFADLARKWSARINLVSRASAGDIWSRHILDSAQLFALGRPEGHWVDLGSGGGFPGLVVAILAAEAAPDLRVTLIESDRRKAAFLRTAARETGLRCAVLAERIEAAEPQAAATLSARALAPLPALLDHVQRHMAPGGVALFPKGASWQKEVAEARREWQFDVEPIKSQTNPQAAILKIEGVSRV